MKRFLLFITLILAIIQLRSQTTCTDQLRLAQTKFDEGSLDAIPQLIDACMKEGFTNEEKTNAYKLLIQTYLFNDQPEKADQVMLLFLKEFPSYALAANDPKEFVNLYGTYRTAPIMKIQLTAGIDLCSPRVTEWIEVANLNKNNAQYKPNIGGMLELNYIDKLYKKLEFSVGGSFSYLRYGYTNNPYQFTSVSGTATDMYIGIPLAIRYSLKFNRINIFGKTGIEPSFLLSSKIDLTRKITTSTEPFTGIEDLTAIRRKYDFRPIVALGIGFKLFKQDFLFSTGIKFGTRVTAEPDMIYNSEESNTLRTKYYFSEDKMVLNQTYFSLSYIFSIYKPKKLK